MPPPLAPQADVVPKRLPAASMISPPDGPCAQQDLVRDGKASACALAELHADLGDSQAAMASRRQSLSRGEADITGVLIEPGFRPLRATPAFRLLAQDAGVVPRS